MCAALVSALDIGVAIKETFTDQYTANIGQLPLNTLIFQDNISKMNDDKTWSLVSNSILKCILGPKRF